MIGKNSYDPNEPTFLDDDPNLTAKELDHEKRLAHRSKIAANKKVLGNASIDALRLKLKRSKEKVITNRELLAAALEKERQEYENQGLEVPADLYDLDD